MSNVVGSIFGQPMFGAAAKRQADNKKAAQGFSQIFATMLSKQMRESMVGSKKGPMGINGGTSGDIYGAFFDQAMGNTLARSASFKLLNRSIERQLSGPRHSISSATRVDAGGSSAQAAAKLASIEHSSIIDELQNEATVVRPRTTVTHFAPNSALPSDARGPILLPPAPTSMAPVLPPPSDIEG